MVNFKTLISTVRAPVQTSTDYYQSIGSPLFQEFAKRKPYCLVKLFLFKNYCLKTFQITVKFCFQSEFRYRTGYLKAQKFLVLKKYGVLLGRRQSPQRFSEFFWKQFL